MKIDERISKVAARMEAIIDKIQPFLSGSRAHRIIFLMIGMLTLAIIFRINGTHKKTANSEIHTNYDSLATSTTPQQSAVSVEPHYCEDACMDQFEEMEIDHLSRAQYSIDIAMSSFTSKRIANVLSKKIEQGVRVRVYRDYTKFFEEERHSGKQNATEILRQAGVPVRVKPAGSAMNLDAYVVDWQKPGEIFREGTADWTSSGMSEQDVSLSYIKDAQAALAFEQQYEDLWKRPENIIVRR